MTAQTIKPNLLFEFWSPDEVAECMISTKTQMGRDLYEKIWDKIVPLLPEKNDENGERKLKYEVPEIYDEEMLAAYWKELTPAEQEFLNDIAENSE